MSRNVPRRILKSPGERIILNLGMTRVDYLLVLNHDDGIHESQIYTCSGSIPDDLLEKLYCIHKANQIITQVTFKTCMAHGDYFVRGAKHDGSFDNFCSNFEKIGSGPGVYSSPRLVTFFGDPSSATVIFGENGSTFHGFKNQELKTRISRVWKSRGTVYALRVFPGPENFFIRDSLGFEYSGDCEAISLELKRECADPVLDIIMSSNGGWIVIRSNSFKACPDIDPTLSKNLADFYFQQQIFIDKQEQAEKLKSENESKVQQEEELQREKVAQQESNARLRKAQELAIQNKRFAQERVENLFSKRIKVGSHVTVVGLSTSIGDTEVKDISWDGIVRARTISQKGQTSQVIDDVSTIVSSSAIDDGISNTHIHLLCQAEDDYEEATTVIAFHCNPLYSAYNAAAWKDLLKTSADDTRSDLQLHMKYLQDASSLTCSNSNTASDVLVSESMKHLIPCSMMMPKKRTVEVPLPATNVSQPAPTRLLFSPVVGNQHDRNYIFDEFKCAERIDIVRLQRLVLHCKTHLKQENGLPQDLETNLVRNDVLLKKLIRCYELEVVAREMLDVLSQYPVDDSGCVSYIVDYQYRDPRFRGHLFAVGKEVYTGSGKFPRTTTLQGVYKELRPVLVGAFAHEIKCENTEVRLLCSLAEQLQLSNLIPTFRSYRDKPNEYLDIIRRAHGATEYQAQKLPILMLNGGNYKQWLKMFKLEDEKADFPDREALYQFIFGLQTEICAVREEMFKHPRFQWVSHDREQRVNSGQSLRSIDVVNFSRTIQNCQNEVLGLIHRSFVGSHFIVRSKIFDRILIEKCPPLHTTDTAAELETLECRLPEIERLCATFGWDVKLVETPLFGLQDQPIKIIDEAIATMNRNPPAIVNRK